jgi:hypothetical protein
MGGTKNPRINLDIYFATVLHVESMANNMLNLGDYRHTDEDIDKLGESMSHLAKDGGFKSLRVRFAIYATAQLSQKELTRLFLKFQTREICEGRAVAPVTTSEA